MIITTRFEEIVVSATHRWIDKETGRKRQKTKKFSQTINPWNKNEHGEVKTRSEIYAELEKEKAKWLREQQDDLP